MWVSSPCTPWGLPKLEYLLVTGPITFLVLGFLMGTRGVELVDLSTNSEIVKVVTEVTLALLLFSDASSVNLAALRRDASVVVRLLFIGLPLAIVFGALSAWALLPTLGLATCALLASILPPPTSRLGWPCSGIPRYPIGFGARST